MTRTLIRPTGFVDAPFGHDGKVARLAGGLNWFASAELIHANGARELLCVEDIEDRFDDAMAADWARLTGPRAPLQMGTRTIRLDQPQVMGIVNATPDSFSDGGAYPDARAAAEAGAVMAGQGAAIIDVGGESTRPGAMTVWEGDEIERVLPVVKQLAAGGTAVSIDTRKASVMRAALCRGRGAGQRRVGADVGPALGGGGGRGRGAGRADASPGRSADDAGRAALRRRAGRGL